MFQWQATIIGPVSQTSDWNLRGCHSLCNVCEIGWLALCGQCSPFDYLRHQLCFQASHDKSPAWTIEKGGKPVVLILWWSLTSFNQSCSASAQYCWTPILIIQWSRTLRICTRWIARHEATAREWTRKWVTVFDIKKSLPSYAQICYVEDMLSRLS